MMPLAFLCDFDGTVSPADIGQRFVMRFARGDRSGPEALAARWRSGQIGHRELTEGECALLRCTAAEAQEFAGGFALDPCFAPFAHAVTRGEDGDVVCVVSEGFDFYIRALLEREALGGLPVASNRVRFEDGLVIPEFPHAADSCGRCGNCKAAHVRAWRARGYRPVAIGDGYSDRCAAREADVVVARGDLLDWCRATGRTAHAFTSFAALAERAAEWRLARPDVAAGASGEARWRAAEGA